MCSLFMLPAQRFRVVEEIVETERKYCTCLWILINHFSESLSESELLTAKDIKYVQFFICYISPSTFLWIFVKTYNC